MINKKIPLITIACLCTLSLYINGVIKANDTKVKETHPTSDVSPPYPGEAAFDGEKYILPPLPYAYDALEPYIDKETMILHHDKHHAAYVAGLNTAVQKIKEISSGKGDAGMTTHWVRQLAFHGSGHAMHCIFWKNMTPNAKPAPEGKLAEAINDSFGNFEGFKTAFKAAASGVEGSGWGILGYDPMSGRLLVLGIEKHQNLSVMGLTPILVCDVWEHAYYLKYQNNRSGYIDNFMKVINWDDVARRYSGVRQ